MEFKVLIIAFTILACVHCDDVLIANATQNDSDSNYTLATQQQQQHTLHPHNAHQPYSNLMPTNATKVIKHNDKDSGNRLNPLNGRAHTLNALVDGDMPQGSYEFDLEKTSILFALTRIANNSQITAQCTQHLLHIRQSVLRKEPWALKVLDSSATLPSGFMFGHNHWLGSREGCTAVQNPVLITLNRKFERIMNFDILTDHSPFDIEYRVAYYRHYSQWQIELKILDERVLHMGLCLPKACNNQDIETMTKDYMKSNLFIPNYVYDIHPEFLYIKNLKLDNSFYERKSFKLLCGAIIGTLLMMLAASFLRVKSMLIAELIDEKQTITTATTTTTLATIATTVNAMKTPLNAAQPNNDDLEDNHLLSKLRAIVKCFDIQSNFDKLYTIRATTSQEIPIMNGMRSISSIWIMCFHVIYFMYFTINNKSFLLMHGEKIFFQYMTTSPLLVDVFFTISGFLQVYNFIGNQKKLTMIRNNNFIQNLREYFKILFHRYLRLAPLYLVMLLIVDVHTDYNEKLSVHYIIERNDQTCSKYWWRNVLFIQNFWDIHDLCMNWSWSLACEMQFYILSSFLLFLYAKKPQLVKNLVLCTFGLTLLWSFYLGTSKEFQFSIDSIYATGNYVYINSFVRITPYIIGSIAAWCLLENKLKLDISDLWEKFAWNLAILTFIVCMYSMFKRDLPYWLSTSLLVFGRVCYSLAICWMIVGSATGRGSWWSRLLEAKVFQQINRLTYAIYLLNPFIVSFFFGKTDSSTPADPLMLCILTVGFSAIVYLISIVFTLAFEMPYANLSSLLLKRNKLKNA